MHAGYNKQFFPPIEHFVVSGLHMCQQYTLIYSHDNGGLDHGWISLSKKVLSKNKRRIGETITLEFPTKN